MKRILTLLTAVSLSLGLAACRSETPYVTGTGTKPSLQTQPAQTQPTQTQPIQTQPTEPVQTTEATIPQQQPYPHPMTAVSLPLMEDAHKSDDGKSIFSYSYQALSLVIPDPSSGSSIAVDFLNHMDFSGSAAENVYKSAMAAYSGQSNWNTYFYRNLYAPTRLDQSVLSLYGVKTYYDGAPHSTVVAQSLNYDLAHGTPLTLQQLLVPDFNSGTLCRLICEGFNSTAAEAFYPDYEAVIEDMFSTNIPINDWYLSDEGLCFFFNPGEIAPYSEEIPVSVIPYQALNGLIQDGFFPEETVEFIGKPFFQAMDQEQTPGFDQIAEVIVDIESPRYCLSVCGTIQDVRILIGGYDANGVFRSEATIFAAQALTESMAALLQCPADWLQQLWVTYRSGDQQYTVSLQELLS